MQKPPVLPFGAYIGRTVDYVPEDYVVWLSKNMSNCAIDLQKAIKARAEKIIDHRNRKFVAKEYASGAKLNIDAPRHVIECTCDMHSLSGDFAFDATIHNSLADALALIASEYPRDDEDVSPTPDQEDDRILIWEVLPSGHRKVVWAFIGYHFDTEEFACGQGTLPGDDIDLYTMADML